VHRVARRFFPRPVPLIAGLLAAGYWPFVPLPPLRGAPPAARESSWPCWSWAAATPCS
jgi:hypothetical protein